MKFELINKAVYFPEEKILTIGDMHLGHEFTYRSPGSQIPQLQVTETKDDLEFIFEKLKKENKKVKKVIFLGDIKHFFSYERGEKNIILEILLLVGKYIDRKNIILIKGNHEKIAEISDKKLLPFYKSKDILFLHGDKELSEIKESKVIVMGHLHPAVVISDEQKIKSEKFKCFLVGKYKRKQVIILPSFLPNVEGTAVNLYLNDNRCFIPKKILEKFNVHVIGKEGILDFGVLKNL